MTDTNTNKSPDPQETKQQLQDSIGTANLGEEQELWEGNYSVKAMAGTGIMLILASIAALILCAVFGASGVVWLWMLGVLAVAWLAYFAVTYYWKLSFHYELTTQRIKHREGFVFRSQDRIELIDISDVKLRQGPFQAMLNVGNIHVVSSDESHPLLVMAGIANAKRVADIIDNARREERRKRGLHIHSI